jgi:hypothetical protein
MLEQNSGGPSTVFLDGETYEPVDAADNPPGAEVRWDPLDADRLVFVEGNRLGTWSPLSGETEVEETFEGFSQLRIGPSEGNLSLDGQRIALIGKKGKRRFAFAYDRAAGELLTKLDLTDSGVDWISISPLGDRLVLNDQRDRTEVFDLDGERIQRWPEYGRPSHYDLALDSNGDQIAVGVAKSGAADGKVIMRRLDDGHVTVLSAGGYASHTSTRNVDRPGWAYVTHDLNRPGDYPPYRDEIFTVKLDGSGKVERLVQMHSRVPDYLSEPQAVPSPDGRRVLFASNWDKRSGRPIGTYVADLRDLCPPD